jgi:negative regulator of flagellin synthesis FlgM
VEHLDLDTEGEVLGRVGGSGRATGPSAFRGLTQRSARRSAGHEHTPGVIKAPPCACRLHNRGSWSPNAHGRSRAIKTDANRSNLDSAALQRLDRAAAEAAKQGGQKTGDKPAGDRVALSADAALAADALKAIQDSPDIRLELIEKMRRLMADGELGANVESLADSLIDNMLDKK